MFEGRGFEKEKKELRRSKKKKEKATRVLFR